jgi:hypothetical protein
MKTLFVKIWLLHIYFYYLVYGLLTSYKNIQLKADSLLLFIVYPAMGGIVGWLDSCVVFFLEPIFLMALLLKYSRLSFYTAYVVSIVASHLIRYAVQLLIFEKAELRFVDDSSDILRLLHLVIALAAISILQYFVFRKSLKRLSAKELINSDAKTLL